VIYLIITFSFIAVIFLCALLYVFYKLKKDIDYLYTICNQLDYDIDYLEEKINDNK
jgi:hypothetical protein